MKKVFYIICICLFALSVFSFGGWTATAFLIHTEAITFMGVAISALVTAGFGVLGFYAGGPVSEKSKEISKMKKVFCIIFICLLAVNLFFFGAWAAKAVLTLTGAKDFIGVAISALAAAGFGIVGFIARGPIAKYSK